jgi:proline iminopeptidase
MLPSTGGAPGFCYGTRDGPLIRFPCLLAVVGLFAARSGEYEVAATLAGDPALPRVTIDGLTFHAETFGDPNNPVVIVVHGGPGGDYRSLLGLKALSDEYSAVFYDQRGSGLSPRVPIEELTLRTSIEDLHHFVTIYGEGQAVHIVGHSWGGILVSAYLGHHPEKVDRAVMAETGFLTQRELEDWFAFQRSLYGLRFYWVALYPGFEA